MMEDTLFKQFKDILDTDNVTGCVLADNHGLCLLSSPNISHETAGIVSAIAQYASKIEPDNSNPVICLEGTKRQCLIKNENSITSAIFKNEVNENT
ncbi:hypothetical protein O3M35_001933 [Rhynocoris fuscipes]|uniref:Late endosomal/lysosomal adaptor and MAPK and MTOR activator 5 n=1 Tax=Rhynocoris fuscipes TaxID=488301 RepID=A0AAW1CVU8_9HEMI